MNVLFGFIWGIVLSLAIWEKQPLFVILAVCLVLIGAVMECTEEK